MERSVAFAQPKTIPKPDTRTLPIEEVKPIVEAKPSKRKPLKKRRKYKPIRTSPNEFTVARYRTSLDVDLILAEVMKILAFQRRVTLSTYLRDVVVAHTCLIADLDQAIFKETLPAGTVLEPPPERWAGYLASLGFAPAVQLVEQPIPHDIPPPPAEIEDHPVPQADMEAAQIKGMAPVETVPAIDYTPHDTREPKPKDPVGIGFGNAAQQYGFGYVPSEITPDTPLREQHEKTLTEEREHRQTQDPI